MANPGVEIICFAESEVSLARKKLGWGVSEAVGYKVFVSPSDHQISSVFIGEEARNCLHILSGVRRIGVIVKAIDWLKRTGFDFGIMSEPRDWTGPKGWLRCAQSWLTEGWLRKNAKYIFAIGANGPKWFGIAGYRAENTYPFAYFINPIGNFSYDRTDSLIRIGFVGRMVAEKGIYHLVDSCVGLPFEYEVIFVGDGPDKSKLIDYCLSKGVKAYFYGAIPMVDIPKVMAGIDIYMQLSTTLDDGWGVAVSEAILSGSAVVVSELVGASAVVVDDLLGCAVKPEDSAAVRREIIKIVEKGILSAECRGKRSDWGVKNLSSTAGAKYFSSIVKGGVRAEVNYWPGGV